MEMTSNEIFPKSQCASVKAANLNKLITKSNQMNYIIQQQQKETNSSNIGFKRLSSSIPVKMCYIVLIVDSNLPQLLEHNIYLKALICIKS